MKKALEESEVERLRALMEGASGLPWDGGCLSLGESGCQCATIFDGNYAGGIGEVYYPREYDGLMLHAETPDIDTARANLRLIVAAVNTLPALLAERDEILSSLSAANAVVAPFAEAARSFTSAIGPDGIDDGLAVFAHIHCRPECEARLSTADFSEAAAFLARLEPAKGEEGMGMGEAGRDPYWEYEENECGNCGGEGFVYGCSWDWQCETWDEGEGTCLCTRPCDWCSPRKPDPELQAVLAAALAHPNQEPQP